MISILLVEDNLADAHLLTRFLAKVDREKFNLTKVESKQAAIRELIEHPFQVILLDLSLPDSQGLNTVVEVHQVAGKTPIVVLTGLNDQQVAMAALREGAQDYLVKGEISPDSLVRSLNYAIERQQILDKLQEVNLQLSRSNKELEQFAYVVSHDLQQPLQSILGFSQLLMYKYGETLDHQGKHYLEHIVAASHRMRQLTKDLLIYAQIGKSIEAIEISDCNQIIEIVKSNLETIILPNKVTVEYQDLPQVKVNKGPLVQLFQNLMENSIKYSRKEVKTAIKITATPKNNSWLFAVKDNGMGIASEDCKCIFEMFKRLAEAKSLPGTGIGLAICQKIVEYHGGEIWVESQINQGSTFYFTLPGYGSSRTTTSNS